MAGQNEVSQVVRLNGTQYRNELGKMQTETRSGMQKIQKDLTDTGNGYRDFTNYIKKQTGSMIGSIEEAGKSFAKNLGRGALAGTALTGVEAMRSGMREAVRTGIDFEAALARVGSRADMSAKQIAKLKQEFFELGKTGAKLESIPAAFDSIYGATGNIDQSKSVMGPIAKAAAMGNGDAGEVADFVKDRLKGAGKEINTGNVQELLQSLVLAQRGGEFNSFGDAMHGMGGVDAASQQRAGLSNREMAGILAGSTRAGADKATGLSGAQALVHMSQQGFGGSAAMAGMLGVGSFMNGGKFDSSRLSAASSNLKRAGRSDSENVALFQGAGLSEQESTGLLAILKNVEKFQAGVKKVATDTKSFEQSFQETTDTLGHRLEQLKNATVHGFNDIFSPLMGVAKKAAGGDLAGAAGALPGAAVDTLGGAASHPLLVGGGLLATAAGGALLKKFGLGGGVGKLGAGLAKGKALQAGAGVTPVYVVNFGEVSGKDEQTGTADAFMKKMSDMAMGGAGAGAGGGAALGVGGVAAGAGIASLAAIAAQASRIADEKDPAKAAKIAEGGDRATGGGSAAAGNALMNALLNWLDKGSTQKVQIEVDSKDPAYMARPKKTDNPRDPRGL